MKPFSSSPGGRFWDGVFIARTIIDISLYQSTHRPANPSIGHPRRQLLQLLRGCSLSMLLRTSPLTLWKCALSCHAAEVCKCHAAERQGRLAKTSRMGDTCGSTNTRMFTISMKVFSLYFSVVVSGVAFLRGFQSACVRKCQDRSANGQSTFLVI